MAARRKSSAERVCEGALAEAQSQWGKGWDRLSQTQQRAFVAERVLVTSALQDSTIDPEIIRTIVNEAWTWLVDRFPEA